ncbi:MAG: hypothetical protein MRZ79_26720 [Bacteroidia bacterium]|nr:hypothetical protein [Bacteroidia bacterium]
MMSIPLIIGSAHSEAVHHHQEKEKDRMGKRYLTIIIFLISFLEINGQNSLFINFHRIDSSRTSIDAIELLEELNWENLKKFCDTTEEYSARIIENQHTKTYEYRERSRAGANFTLVVYKGKVLEYYASERNIFYTSYFDRKLLIEYIYKDEKNRNSKWALSEKELSVQSNKVIEAYYTLLGFIDSRDEYGWLCEYSAIGYPPKKRRAVLTLINSNKRDFLVKLLDHPNTQTKLYAADALIYLDMVKEIETVEFNQFKGRRRGIRRLKISYIQSYKLKNNEWRKIKQIRDDKLDVVTCGNSGSFKQYKSTTRELLSKESISEIYNNYQLLKKVGYLKIPR